MSSTTDQTPDVFESLMATVEGRHPSVLAACRWFDHAHLPEPIGRVSAIFARAALDLVAQVAVDDPQLTLALQDLIRAKDAACRARRAASDAASAP